MGCRVKPGNDEVREKGSGTPVGAFSTSASLDAARALQSAHAFRRSTAALSRAGGEKGY
jgi:hypothetical protein